MSNRTAQADKAIRDAWKREKELVLEGKGTRNWTPDQQKDILERGRAYDENGKAFEGHHMISVENNPDYQGCSENIQFLTKPEHLAAHNGCFQNPTNGYYDPSTGETKIFKDGTFEPCEIIELQESVLNSDRSLLNEDVVIPEKRINEGASKSEQVDKKTKVMVVDSKKHKEFLDEFDKKMHELREKGEQIKHTESPHVQYVSKRAESKGFWWHCKRGAIKVGNFLWDNRSAIIHFVGNAAQIVLEYKLSEMMDSDDDEYYHNNRSVDRSDISNSINSEIAEHVDEIKIDRAPPEEHTVRASGQHYWINGERVWKEKAAYQRGGRDNDD